MSERKYKIAKRHPGDGIGVFKKRYGEIDEWDRDTWRWYLRRPNGETVLCFDFDCAQDVLKTDLQHLDSARRNYLRQQHRLQPGVIA